MIIQVVSQQIDVVSEAEELDLVHYITSRVESLDGLSFSLKVYVVERDGGFLHSFGSNDCSQLGHCGRRELWRRPARPAMAMSKWWRLTLSGMRALMSPSPGRWISPTTGPPPTIASPTTPFPRPPPVRKSGWVGCRGCKQYLREYLVWRQMRSYLQWPAAHIIPSQVLSF